jgi:hypothetical protein
MKNRFMIFALGLFCAAAVTQAGLWDPPITDPSFEAVENGADHSTLGNWGYVFDEWFENPDDTAVFWEKGTAIGLESDGDMWLGCETGGAAYQAIGTVDDGVTFNLKALIGNRGGSSFGTGAFSLYAGGSDTDGGDGVALDSIASLLDSVEVTTADGTLVSENVYEVDFELSTGTGNSGETLWFQVESVSGKDYFDYVRLETSLSAYGPDPADDAEGVALDKILSWYTGPDPNNPANPNPLITKHFVYMNSGLPDDPNLLLVATIDAGTPTQPTAQYDPAEDFSRDGVYLWRVDEGIGDYGAGDPNNITGKVWTFMTVTSEPMLDENLPADVVIYAGENASFVVDATNPYTLDDTGMSYAWYKAGDATVLSTTDTLDITNAQIADDGGYYCTVTLDANGAEVDSRTAILTIKRAIGWWKLEEDTVDSSDLGNDGAIVGAPPNQSSNWTDGIDGRALNVNTEGIPYVEVPAADSVAYNLTKRISVSVWVKSAGSPNGYGVLVGKQLDNVNRPWMLRQNGTNPWVTWKTHEDYWAVDTVRCFDDAWHHVVATWDIDTGEKNIYMDGELKATKEMTGEALSDDLSPIRIGYYYSTYYFTGVLDDARIYNYALSPLEIASLYVGFVPDAEICLQYPDYDLTDDCQVNLDDLAVFLSDWMKCNIYPTCIN